MKPFKAPALTQINKCPNTTNKPIDISFDLQLNTLGINIQATIWLGIFALARL